MGINALTPTRTLTFNILQQPQFGSFHALVNGVLRITATTSDKVVLKLEGRLMGPWVDELTKTVLQTNASSLPLEIDVSGLTFADGEGERALAWLYRMGAHFQGKGLFTKCLFERLKIPLFSRQTNFDESDDR